MSLSPYSVTAVSHYTTTRHIDEVRAYLTHFHVSSVNVITTLTVVTTIKHSTPLPTTELEMAEGCALIVFIIRLVDTVKLARRNSSGSQGGV